MLSVDIQPLQNFSVSQKSALIAHISDCDLNKKALDRLRELHQECDLTDAYLRPIRHEDFVLKEEKRSSGSDIFESQRDLESDWKVQCACEVEELFYIVVELKKMEVQTSPSGVLRVLANAREWLTLALTATSDSAVGADEVFEFFVFCLSCARISHLPALTRFCDVYVDDALRETAFEYFIQTLKSALDFIENRLMPVQPFVLFPFEETPPALASSLKLQTSQELHGFELWAFQTWDELSEKTPALIRYTGAPVSCKCFQFSIVQKFALSIKLDAIPTLHGTFLQLTPDFIAAHGMILVETGNYSESSKNIKIVSAMCSMIGGRVSNPSVRRMNKLFDALRQMWRFPKIDLNEVEVRVAEVQRALGMLGFLPNGSAVSGILDVSTRNALASCMQACIGLSGPVHLIPRVYEMIMTLNK
jgi:hypothetical protein